MPNPSFVQLMARIRGVLLFYRLFFLIPGLLLTCIGCYLYHRNVQVELTIIPAIYAMKILTLGMTAWMVSRRKELYYFFNLGINSKQLITAACTIDLLIFITGLTATAKLL